MEYSGLTNIGDDRCTNLCWKGMFIEVTQDLGLPHSGDRLFWCHKTQNCLGPDGKIADDYECNPARNCYKPL